MAVDPWFHNYPILLLSLVLHIYRMKFEFSPHIAKRSEARILYDDGSGDGRSSISWSKLEFKFCATNFLQPYDLNPSVEGGLCNSALPFRQPRSSVNTYVVHGHNLSVSLRIQLALSGRHNESLIWRQRTRTCIRTHAGKKEEGRKKNIKRRLRP